MDENHITIVYGAHGSKDYVSSFSINNDGVALENNIRFGLKYTSATICLLPSGPTQ